MSEDGWTRLCKRSTPMTCRPRESRSDCLSAVALAKEEGGDLCENALIINKQMKIYLKMCSQNLGCVNTFYLNQIVIEA